MELGRECLEIWGYKRVDELIWVKTNQLQRLIRTGRTGHWLNHSKEHCLVGLKGEPAINRCIDCDVLVAEVGSGPRLLSISRCLYPCYLITGCCGMVLHEGRGASSLGTALGSGWSTCETRNREFLKGHAVQLSQRNCWERPGCGHKPCN
jgi:hypothetical protein